MEIRETPSNLLLASRMIKKMSLFQEPFYNWETSKEKISLLSEKRWLEDRRYGGGPVPSKEEPGGIFYPISEATEEETDFIAWSIRNECKGTQFMRYFEEEEGLDLRKNSQEYAGWANRELAGTAAKGLWVDRDLETEIKNLFAAGDEVRCSMGVSPVFTMGCTLERWWLSGNGGERLGCEMR
jgi:hypothetical protein